MASSTIAYTDGPNNGTQVYGGYLALNFNVNSTIYVTDLGVFNASGSGNIGGNIQVSIYNNTTHALVTPVVTFHGSYTPGGAGYDVFQAITPVALGAGSYQVEAVGFNSLDPNGNINLGSAGPTLNTGLGALTFAGAAYGGNNPQSCTACQGLPQQSWQFDTGTFAFSTSSPVPEPGTMGLLVSGLFVAAGAVRRRIGH